MCACICCNRRHHVNCSIVANKRFRTWSNNVSNDETLVGDEIATCGVPCARAPQSRQGLMAGPTSSRTALWSACVCTTLAVTSSRFQPSGFHKSSSGDGTRDGGVGQDLRPRWLARLCSTDENGVCSQPQQQQPRARALPWARQSLFRRGTAQADVLLVSEPTATGGEVQQQQKTRRRRRRRSRAPKLAPYESAFEDLAPRREQGDKKRVLMLISDTGGGHRASAQAMESMMEQLAPGACDVRIVDVFTDYCPWPFNKFVPGYAVMAKNAWMWKLMARLQLDPPGASPPAPAALQGRLPQTLRGAARSCRLAASAHPAHLHQCARRDGRRTWQTHYPIRHHRHRPRRCPRLVSV